MNGQRFKVFTSNLPCNIFPIKPTINLSKFCLSNFDMLDSPNFAPSKLCTKQYSGNFQEQILLFFNLKNFTPFIGCMWGCSDP